MKCDLVVLTQQVYEHFILFPVETCVVVECCLEIPLTVRSVLDAIAMKCLPLYPDQSEKK